MWAARAASLLRRAALHAPLAVAGAATFEPARCGWFSKDAAAAKKNAAEDEIARLRAALGPLAALDLNGDGKVDAADAKLAFEKARAAAGGDALLREIGAHASAAVATGVPTQISYGFCAGYCTGFAAKKAGKVLAVAFGGAYVFLQCLAYYGYIDVNHDIIKRRFTDVLDVNKDGAVDSSDGEVLYAQAMEVLQYNGPSGGGFSAGVVMGLRSG